MSVLRSGPADRRYFVTFCYFGNSGNTGKLSAVPGALHYGAPGCRLSASMRCVAKIWWREKDLNFRPLRYERSELPDCSIPLKKVYHNSVVGRIALAENGKSSGVSFGTVLQMVVLIAGLGVAYGVLKAEVDTLKQKVGEIVTTQAMILEKLNNIEWRMSAWAPPSEKPKRGQR